MENDKLTQSTRFLEECLNNRSKIINHEDFYLFLEKYSKIVRENSLSIVVKIKPSGEICKFCKKYIPRISLNNSISLETDSFVCSVNCMRKLREAQIKCWSRKMSGNSISPEINKEICLFNKEKNCIVY
jgi:hypothetical protein